MGITLDADVIIRGEKGLFDLYAWLAGRDEPVEIAAITIAELWHGAERATAEHKAPRMAYLKTTFEEFEIVPYTERTAYEHARIWAEMNAAGKMIDLYDLIVAATALERGNAVATFNRRRFGMVAGLNIIEPK